MSVDLSPDVWNEIQRQFASGSYASPDEVVRVALAALRSHDEEVLAIQEGIHEMEAGCDRPFREFAHEFQRCLQRGPTTLG
jgi:putative addiction module CopG family antidote